MNASLAALPAHAPARGAGRPVCGPARPDLLTVRQTPSIRVFQRRDDPQGYSGRKYLCRRGRPAVWSLTTDPTFSSGQSTGRLVGPFLLVGEGFGGGVGDNSAAVHVVDTRTGRFATTGRQFATFDYDALQVTGEGIAVWLAYSAGDAGTRIEVMAIGADGTTVTLDDGPAASELRLTGRTATWRQGGAAARSHTFEAPPRYRERLSRVRFAQPTRHRAARAAPRRPR